jgi:hypothetical protein
MNIRASITPIAQALLISAIVLIAGNGKSYAQADTDKVNAVIDAYHAALSALDAAKMAALWARDDSVMDIEPPDKAITLGRQAVKKNFEEEFSGFSELKVTQGNGAAPLHKSTAPVTTQLRVITRVTHAHRGH